MDWSDGYVTEVDYVHEYYRELCPSLQRFAALAAGYAAPDEGGRYLELGFGQGTSAIIHAAASPCEMWGTDFYPAQALNAVSLAKAGGVKAHLFDESFAEFAARDDLPKFDYIALHGIWSWVSDENRHRIVDILRDRLAIGGIGYISYNAMPGWSGAVSLRNLMRLHSDITGSEAQGIASRVEAAMSFARRVAGASAGYFTANPAALERLNHIAGQNRNYLAHEYLNREWHPMGFSDVCKWLSPAKLEFAASVRLLDQLDMLNLPPPIREMVRQIQHPILKESVRDYAVNRIFRTDLFFRGLRRLSPAQWQDQFSKVKFVLRARAEDIPLRIQTSLGEGDLQESVYRPVINALAKNGYRPRSFADLQADLPSMDGAKLVECLSVLIGMGSAHPAQSDAAIKKAGSACAALNKELCRRAEHSEEITELASPVTGGGVNVTRFQQLFLGAMAAGQREPANWAQSAWNILLKQGKGLMKDGKPLTTSEENLAELTVQAKEFAVKRLPILKALEIV